MIRVSRKYLYFTTLNKINLKLWIHLGNVGYISVSIQGISIQYRYNDNDNNRNHSPRHVSISKPIITYSKKVTHSCDHAFISSRQKKQKTKNNMSGHQQANT